MHLVRALRQLGLTFGSEWRLSRCGASLFACALLVICAYFIEDVWLAVGVITAGSFCASLSGPCAYTITIEMGGEHDVFIFQSRIAARKFGNKIG